MKPNFTAADRLVVGYNILMAVAWSSVITESELSLPMIGMHAVLVVSSLAAARIDANVSPTASAVRHTYPLLFVILFWMEMGLIRDVFHDVGYDARIVAVELAVSGRLLHQVFAQAIALPWFAETMSIIYVLYYPVVFVTPVIIALRRSHDAASDIVFTLAVAYCVCFVSCLFFPVDGPKRYLGVIEGAGTNAVVYTWVQTLVHAGDSLGTAFPSSHVVGAVVMALLAARWFSRPIAFLFAIEAAGVMASTVYCQHHYFIDMVAGSAVAVAVFFLIAPVLRRAADAHPARAMPRPFWPVPIREH